MPRFKIVIYRHFPFSALTRLLGDREDIRPVRSWFVGDDDLTGPLHVLLSPLLPSSSAPIKLANPGWEQMQNTSETAQTSNSTSVHPTVIFDNFLVICLCHWLKYWLIDWLIDWWSVDYAEEGCVLICMLQTLTVCWTVILSVRSDLRGVFYTQCVLWLLCNSVRILL